MVYWKKVYREIYVLENNVQGRLCTMEIERGKYCNGKMCTRKYEYWKNVYKENSVQGDIKQEKNVLKKCVHGNLCIGKLCTGKIMYMGI